MKEQSTKIYGIQILVRQYLLKGKFIALSAYIGREMVSNNDVGIQAFKN